MVQVVTRFAPSPTGRLHVGNYRVALVNWLFARKYDGKFILRVDNTDLVRCTDEYTQAIYKDLSELGLNYNTSVTQSSRMDRYNQIKQDLIEKGLLYPCYETKDELELKRKSLLGRGKAPIYDREALRLSDQQLSYMQETRKPHYRFKLSEGSIMWKDMVRGAMKFESKNISDPILIREDGSFTYMLCSIIDDYDMGITHVIRGEDHLTNTAIQISMMQDIFAGYEIQYGHLSLIKSQDGEISKRDGGYDIHTLLHMDHIEPITLASFFASSGTSRSAIHVAHEMADIVEKFNISEFSKSPSIYAKKNLLDLNKKVVRSMPIEKLVNSYPEYDVRFLNLVKDNISTLHEVVLWHAICQGEVTPVIEDRDIVDAAHKHLPSVFEDNSWSEWINKISQETGCKGKKLFMCLRLAITGQDTGPELKYMVQIMERSKIERRLLGQGG